MIRYMRWRTGRRAVFAWGNALDVLWLWFRGYRRHSTAFGSVMAKWFSGDAAKGEK